MSSAAATACTRTPRCRLRRTAASLNSALYSWTFFGPARGTRHLPLLGGSVYKSEAGSPASFKRLLGSPLQLHTSDLEVNGENDLNTHRPTITAPRPVGRTRAQRRASRSSDGSTPRTTRTELWSTVPSA